MSGRTLTEDVAEAIAAEVVARTVAVELDFPSGAVRWTGAHTDIVIDGNTFSGLGTLGSVSVVEESAALRAFGMVTQVSGVPRDVITLALDEAYQGREGTVWEVPLQQAAWRVIDEPILIFRGRMDQMTITYGPDCTVGVSLENRLIDWERPRIRRYTSEDQQAVYPTDTGFRWVPLTAQKKIL